MNSDSSGPSLQNCFINAVRMFYENPQADRNVFLSDALSHATGLQVTVQNSGSPPPCKREDSTVSAATRTSANAETGHIGRSSTPAPQL